MAKRKVTIMTRAFVLLAALSFIIDAVLLLNVYGNGNDDNIGDSARQTGCIAGSFTATYPRQSVGFSVERAFLCGGNLHYRFINEEGLQVYNEKQDNDAKE